MNEHSKSQKQTTSKSAQTRTELHPHTRLGATPLESAHDKRRQPESFVFTDFAMI
jgi:predicted secreted protein